MADVIEAQAAASPTGIEGAAEALAHHRSRSEEPEKAFSHLLSAGHRAGSRTGLREALGFFEQALAIVESGRCRVERSVLFELLEATGRAQLGLGDLAGVARTFEAAAGLRPLKAEFTPSSSQRALAMEWSALGFITGGNLSAAEERLMTGLAGAVGPKDERSGILHLLSELRWHAGDYSAALEAAQRSTDEAHQAGDGEMAQAGRDLAALAQRSLGVEPAAFAPASGTVRCHRVFDVHLAFWERDLAGDRPRRQIEAGVALYGEWARRRRSAPGEALARTMEGALALASARWDLAEAALRDAVVLQRSSGSALAEAFTLERLGILLTARGRVEEGMSVLAEGVIAAERGALRRHGLTRLNASLARNRLVAGAVYAAEDCIRQASETAARHGDCAVCDAHFRPAAIRVALARGRIGDAEAESAQLEAIAVRRGGRVFEAIARAARAQVLAAQGRWHEAHSAAEEARQVFLSVDAVFEAARCLIIESQALRARAATGPDDLLLANRVASAAAEVFGPFEPPSTDT